MEEKTLYAFNNLTRLQIVVCLYLEEKCVIDLIENCKLSQSAVSQHLAILRKNDIVNVRAKGKKVFYSLKNPELGKIAFTLFNLKN